MTSLAQNIYVRPLWLYFALSNSSICCAHSNIGGLESGAGSLHMPARRSLGLCWSNRIAGPYNTALSPARRPCGTHHLHLMQTGAFRHQSTVGQTWPLPLVHHHRHVWRIDHSAHARDFAWWDSAWREFGAGCCSSGRHPLIALLRRSPVTLQNSISREDFISYFHNTGAVAITSAKMYE